MNFFRRILELFRKPQPQAAAVQQPTQTIYGYTPPTVPAIPPQPAAPLMVPPVPLPPGAYAANDGTGNVRIDRGSFYGSPLEAWNHYRSLVARDAALTQADRDVSERKFNGPIPFSQFTKADNFWCYCLGASNVWYNCWQDVGSGTHAEWAAAVNSAGNVPAEAMATFPTIGTLRAYQSPVADAARRIAAAKGIPL